tara:strand:- start:1778 stop:3031 length:1254 start_codon:yes stop_codon:yes gene_type:complete
MKSFLTFVHFRSWIILLFFLSSCKSTTLITSNPPGADLYISDTYKGTTPYKYSDRQPTGSPVRIELRKDGFETLNERFNRNQRLDWGVFCFGGPLLIPYFWLFRYDKTNNFNLKPLSKNSNNSINRLISSDVSVPKNDGLYVVGSESVQTSSVDREIPEQSVQKTNRYALVLGCEDYYSYQNSLLPAQNVPFAAHDAYVFAEYAQKYLGVSDDNLFLLINGTSGQIRQKMELLSQIIAEHEKRNESSEVIFYYAGHGLPDAVSKVPFLIPVDIAPDNLDLAIEMSEVYEEYNGYLKNKLIVFLDACFTGDSRADDLIASRGVQVKPKLVETSGKVVTFSASSEVEAALSFDQQGHGMFTYFVLKKMQLSPRGISLGELGDYLKREIPLTSLKINGVSQNPSISPSRQLGESWRGWRL